tara:strand:- start:745 stop:1077 length:333 start_codon:yes stop_codon:yes gene_type:complete
MTMPPSGTLLGRVADIPDPGGRVASWPDLPIILARKGEEVRAYLNVCPHAGRPMNLPDGRVIAHAECYLICPAHGAIFDILSGQGDGALVSGDALEPVAIRVENGDVLAV